MKHRVVSKMFAPKITKICQFLKVTIIKVGDVFWRISLYFNSYVVGSVFPRQCRNRHWVR